MLATTPWRSFSPAAPDPLEGDWVTTFPCPAMVAAVEAARVSPHDQTFWLRAESVETGSPDPERPCAGSPPDLSYPFRFTDGRLQIFDRTGSEGFDGKDEVSEETVTVRDPRTRNIQGAYRSAFRIADGELTIQPLGRASSDPFYIAVWGTAPFVHAS